MRNWKVLISIKFHERYSNWFIFYVPTFRVSLGKEMRECKQRSFKDKEMLENIQEKPIFSRLSSFQQIFTESPSSRRENLENCIFFLSAFACLVYIKLRQYTFEQGSCSVHALRKRWMRKVEQIFFYWRIKISSR